MSEETKNPASVSYRRREVLLITNKGSDRADVQVSTRGGKQKNIPVSPNQMLILSQPFFYIQLPDKAGDWEVRSL